MDLDKMLAEEKAMDEVMFGNNGEESAATAQGNPDNTKEDLSTVPVETKATQGERKVDTTVEKQSPTKQEVNWEHRFKQYKATTDVSLHNYKTEKANLLDRVASLTSKVDELSNKLVSLVTEKKDPFNGVITQEDSDTIGPEAIDIFSRGISEATEQATAPLKKELERLKAKETEELRQKAEFERRQVYENKFLIPLEKIVPNYLDINVSQDFADYLDGFDPITGELRRDAFIRAENALSVSGVVHFFKDYESQSSAVITNPLERRVTPEANGAATPNEVPKENKIRFTISEFEKNYDDFQKGVYKGREKEWKTLEAQMDAAYRSGNIV